MKTALLLSLPFFSQLFLWTGTYVKETNPWESLGDSRDDSRLLLNIDHTFSYRYSNTSTNNTCIRIGFGYTISGKWETRDDTLILINELDTLDRFSVAPLRNEKRFYHIEFSQPGYLGPKLIFIPMWNRNHDANTMLGNSLGNFKFDD